MKTAFVLSFLASWGVLSTCLKIQLFDNVNFNGFYQTLSSTKGCTNLTEDWRNFLQEVRSMKTDTCIIIFKEPDCASHSYRLEPGKYADLALIKHDTINFINTKSYNLCTNRSFTATASLNVDIWGTAMTVGDGNSVHQGQHVCNCVNLSPRSPYVGLVTGLTNFQNCVIIYEDNNCQGRNLTLLAGDSPESQKLPDDYNFLIPSTSIAPCHVAPSCYSLKVQAYKFLLNSKISLEGVKAFSENVTFGTTTILRTNGTASISQLYEASESVDESVEVTRIPGFSNPSATFVTAKYVTFEISGNHVWNMKNVKHAILNAYQTSSDASKNGDTFTAISTREVKVEQNIELRPCSEYAVNSYITMVQRVPLEYEFYAIVSGSKRERDLSAEETKERLVEGLEYIQDIDNSSVLAKGTGMVLMDFVLHVEVDRSSQQVKDCPFP